MHRRTGFALPCLALPCLALPCLALPSFALTFVDSFPQMVVYVRFASLPPIPTPPVPEDAQTRYWKRNETTAKRKSFCRLLYFPFGSCVTPAHPPYHR